MDTSTLGQDDEREVGNLSHHAASPLLRSPSHQGASTANDSKPIVPSQEPQDAGPRHRLGAAAFHAAIDPYQFDPIDRSRVARRQARAGLLSQAHGLRCWTTSQDVAMAKSLGTCPSAALETRRGACLHHRSPCTSIRIRKYARPGYLWASTTETGRESNHVSRPNIARRPVISRP